MAGLTGRDYQHLVCSGWHLGQHAAARHVPHPDDIANNAAPMTTEACTLPLNAAATGWDDAFTGHPQVLVNDAALDTSPTGPGFRQHPLAD